MRIGIDGRALRSNALRAGTYRYVFELCKELDIQIPQGRFFIYSNAPVHLPVISNRWVVRRDSLPFASRMKPILWLKTRCGALCRRDDLDVFWGTASFLPRLSSFVRTVMTVYDLNFKIVPDTMSRTHRGAFDLFYRKDVLSANSIISISKGTSDRLLQYFGRSADAIVKPAVATLFRRRSEREILETLSSYGLSRPYILAVANWEPRKNLELLIKTFLQLKNAKKINTHKLVLVGGRGWKDQRLADLASKNDCVHALGYVPDENLPSLYSGAAFFVFPSLYEGFGIPVMEARACGTVVLTSDIPELREAGGDDATYVTPDAQGLYAGLHQVLSRTHVVKNGTTKLHTWSGGAKILASAITKDV